MKSIYTLLLFLLFQPAFSQDTDSYYSPPLPEMIGKKVPSVESLLSYYGQIRVENRWYFAGEGVVRTDQNKINNTLDGLLSTRSVTGAGWGASVGWVSKEQWGVEVSYLRAAIHTIMVVSSTYPLEYKIANDKNYLTIRGKRRLLFGKSMQPRSAFWISAGISAIPNSGRQKEVIDLIGYARRGRQEDTLRLQGEGRVSNGVTGVVDLGLEYAIKAGKKMEVSLYTRRQWGLGTSVKTIMNYTVNRENQGTSVITANGTGWTFGIGVRYNFHIVYDFEDLNRSFKPKGK